MVPGGLTLLQHCIMEWIKQDSSKGQCPMCRQSESSLILESPGTPTLKTVFLEFEWEPIGGAPPQELQEAVQQSQLVPMAED